MEEEVEVEHGKTVEERIKGVLWCKSAALVFNWWLVGWQQVERKEGEKVRRRHVLQVSTTHPHTTNFGP